MGVAASRLLGAVWAAGIAAGGIAAGAAPPAARGPGPAACAGHVAARFTDATTHAGTHRITVVLSSTGNAACTLSGFPALVLPSAHDAPLPAGHVTLPADVVLAPRSPAAFGVRYETSQAPAAACSVSVVVNDRTTAEGTLPLAACASIVQLDVTGYASGTQPPVVLPPPAPSTSLAPCAARDLALREVWTAPGSEFTSGAIYVLQNHGSACRISGNVGIRLLDANGQEYPIPSVPRRTMALLLALGQGEEASFTLSYAGQPRAACPTAAREPFGRPWLRPRR